MEWENLTLLLASTAACCMSDDPALNAPLEYLIPIRKGVTDEKPSVLVKRFIFDVVALLVNPWVPAQVIARDALGVDLTPKLFPVLFEYLNLCVCIMIDVGPSGGRLANGCFLHHWQAHPRDVRRRRRPFCSA